MNVPKLRFKEFNDEYVKLKYKDVLKIKSGKDQKQVENKNGKYPILGTGGQIGKTNSFLYDKPSVLIGRKGTINKPQYMESPFWTVDTLFYSHIYEPNIPKYLFYSFQNVNWKKYDESTGVPSLSSSTIENVECNIPSPNEQIKVANFLSLLDKKIELQTKKIEDLKLFKLSKYSSVFSKSNNKIKLSDICIIEKGKQINSDLLIEKGNYYMLNGGILPSGYLNEYNTNENTITISEGGNSCGYVNFNKTKFWCGGHCYKIISSSVNSSYLYHLLKHNEKIIMDLRVGSGLPNIQKKDLEALKLSIHKNDEQLKIGILFDTFDKKINLEAKKLNKFKELKKALMQVMFV